MGGAGGTEKDVRGFMKTDYIKEIRIDSSGRLCIYPEKEKFTWVWRTATEVHWMRKSYVFIRQGQGIGLILTGISIL
jgi:hypothetical protein